jgi:putative ABC transport system permease protein
MNLAHVAVRGLIFYRRTHVAVALGIATAVAVLAGALLVGGSVRRSLALIATSRLGRTDVIVSAATPFGERLADRIAGIAPDPATRANLRAVPLLVIGGVVQHEPSGRRASDIRVYGIDRRFFSFHGVTAEAPANSDLLLSPDLAVELSAAAGDAVLLRVERPTDIPIDSLQGRKDDAARTLRMRSLGSLAAETMGEFSLAPTQGPVRAAFVSLTTLQRNLDLPGRTNAILVSGPDAIESDVRARLRTAIDTDDIGLRFRASAPDSSIVVESAAGLVPDGVAKAIETAATRESIAVTPVLTWLANRMTVGDRSVPYSLVTALGPSADGDAAIAEALAGEHDGSDPIVLNAWAAQDLRAINGAALELEYYRWTDEGRLVTESHTFRVAATVPMSGLVLDRRLAPDYPGITGSAHLSDWDPPFPINLALVRPADEDYWRQYRATPKGFVPLDVGHRLWASRHGGITSLRVQAHGKVGPEETVNHLRAEIRTIDPSTAGFTIANVRAQTVAASEGATDFASYFAAFSFFLMISAILLTALFARLSIEQRAPQIGVLRAAGFPSAAVGRLFFFEGVLVSIVGSLAGVALAIGWAAVMMHGLRTWWVGAVGTTALRLHVDPWSLVVGAVAGILAGAVSSAMTFRRLAHSSPRALLTGASHVAISGGARGSGWIAGVALGLAVLLGALSTVGVVPAAGGFFGAGSLILVGGLTEFRRWLGKLPRRSFYKNRKTTSEVISLGIRNAAWRPGRSLTAAGLMGAAVFLIVSVDAFRKDLGTVGGVTSGTGGFALVAESTMAIVRDPSTEEGRDALDLTPGGASQTLRDVSLVPVRLRPGDDTSCLNLYQPKRPRVLGVSDRFVDAGRFRFSKSMATTSAERTNPWLLLRRATDDGIVPAIADATSLEYVLHASVGDVITIDSDSSRPKRLRIVGSLDDSILQGELVIAERPFFQLFPETTGYRLLLIEVPGASAARLDEVARLLEERLEPFGLDVQETTRRLEAYHRVENTYLSTFQALGGLGLLLGGFGLAAVVARNVLERRRELALLAAAGFTPRHLTIMVVAENGTLVAAGLGIGLVAASLAVVPVAIGRSMGMPHVPVIGLSAIAAAALLSAPWAARQVRRLPLVESLRSE